MGLTALQDAMQCADSGQPLDDNSRELLITHHAACMDASAVGSSERKRHWETMRELILGRSPAAVEAMEKAKGLRK